MKIKSTIFASVAALLGFSAFAANARAASYDLAALNLSGAQSGSSYTVSGAVGGSPSADLYFLPNALDTASAGSISLSFTLSGGNISSASFSLTGMQIDGHTIALAGSNVESDPFDPTSTDFITFDNLSYSIDAVATPTVGTLMVEVVPPGPYGTIASPNSSFEADLFFGTPTAVPLPGTAAAGLGLIGVAAGLGILRRRTTAI